MKSSIKRIIALIIAPVIAASVVPSMCAAKEGGIAEAGKVYYVDNVNGSDKNDGLSEDNPWKSLDRVNETVFNPGDTIKLKSGCKWVGQLNPKGSGTEGKPITLTCYGEGSKPHIAGEGTTDTAVLLFNQEWWEIDGIEVSNNAKSLGDYRGIGIKAVDTGALKHYAIRNCYIHDVMGETKYFGNNDTRYEDGKRTGGIVFWTDTVNKKPTWFEDVLIEDNEISYNGFVGIGFKHTNKAGWALREGGPYDPNWYPHRYITIRNNYFEQNNPEHQRVPILLVAVKGAIVEKNTLNTPIQCGIELNYADSVLVQFNEVYNSIIGNNGADSCGIDFDRACSNTVWQFNYINECNVGLLTCHGIDYWDFGFGNVVRYNIFQNCKESLLYDCSTGGPDYFYDNIFYNDKYDNVKLFKHGASQCEAYITNNIFYWNAKGSNYDEITNGRTIDNNIYCGEGFSPIASDANSRTIDPKFENSGKGEIGTRKDGMAFGSLSGYKINEPSVSATNAADALAVFDAKDEAYYEKVAEYAAAKGEKPVDVYTRGWDIYVHEPSETVGEALSLIEKRPSMLGHYMRYEELYDGKAIECFYNGKVIDFAANGAGSPFVKDSRTLVPLRALTEEFGAEVQYSDSEEKATIKLNDTEVVVGVNDKLAVVDGKAVELDVAAALVDNRIFVPLRFVSESFEKDVKWVNDTEKAGIIYINDVVKTVINYAYSATVTASEEMDSASIYQINDGSLYTSANAFNPVFPITITYSWDQPKLINKVALYCGASLGQAPTSWDIEVSTNGVSGWKKVASTGYVTWRTASDDIESFESVFEAEEVKGLRLTVHSANTTWGKMVIREIEITGED